MNKAKYCIFTIAPDADTAARQYGLGLEIAEYCTAWNIDTKARELAAYRYRPALTAA